MCLDDGLELALDQCFQPRVATQRLLQCVALLGELVLLASDLHLLQLCQITEFEIEDRFGLDITDLEGLHQHRFGFILLADNADHLVDVQIGDEVPLKNMHAPLDTFKPVLQTPLNRCLPAGQPLYENRDQRLHRWPPIDTDHIQVHTVGALQIGCGKQVTHHAIEVDTVRPGYEHQSGRMLVIRLIAQIRDHRKFAGLHLRRNLFEHLGARDLMWQRMNHHRAVLDRIRCADPERAATRLIQRAQLLSGRDDLGFGGKIRPFDVLAKIGNRCLWRVQQMNGRRHHFVQIVGGNIGSHPDRNASGAVQQ